MGYISDGVLDMDLALSELKNQNFRQGLTLDNNRYAESLLTYMVT